MPEGKRKFKVVVQKPEGISFDLADSAYRLEYEGLAPVGAEIVEIPAKTEDEFIASARDADAVIARGRRITEKIINGLDKCVVIGLGSVGADPVDVAAATRRGIVVTNVPDVFIEEVADHTMAMLLAAHRRLKQMDQLVRGGRWREGRPTFLGIPRLWGQTLGLVSFGNVSRAVARRAKPFGFQILAYDPYISELKMTGEGVEPVTSLAELCQRSDFVSMHAPWTAETTKLMKEEHFRAMKPSAIFVNNGRGKTVDEPSLIRALKEKWIAGAALDVFFDEPVDIENPLLHMDNVIVTPHIASATARMMPETRRRLGRELAIVLSGRWPRSCVNPDVLPRTKLVRWQPYDMDRGPGG
ncbi:MAG: C-terminal binding protein [Chloroflexi bacterium]|nr:C-terminal binding protein [Chloroflexota bacterium]